MDPSADYDTVVSPWSLNDALAADERVQVAVVPFGDGVTFGRKLPAP